MVWSWQQSKKVFLSLVEKNDKNKMLRHKRLRAISFDQFSALPLRKSKVKVFFLIWNVNEEEAELFVK